MNELQVSAITQAFADLEEEIRSSLNLIADGASVADMLNESLKGQDLMNDHPARIAVALEKLAGINQ